MCCPLSDPTGWVGVVHCRILWVGRVLSTIRSCGLGGFCPLSDHVGWAGVVLRLMFVGGAGVCPLLEPSGWAWGLSKGKHQPVTNTNPILPSRYGSFGSVLVGGGVGVVLQITPWVGAGAAHRPSPTTPVRSHCFMPSYILPSVWTGVATCWHEPA